jgi:hypothetical protein
MTATEIITAYCLACAADAGLAVYLQMAENTISTGFFQGRVDNSQLAIALKALHIWTLAQRTLGEAGMVSGKGEGQLNLSFVSTALSKGIDNANLRQTGWGMQLLDLIKQQGPAARSVQASPVAGVYYSPADLKTLALELLDYF